MNPFDYIARLLDFAVGTGARAAKLAAAAPGVAAAERAIGKAVNGAGPVPTDTALDPAAVLARTVGDQETATGVARKTTASTPPPMAPALARELGLVPPAPSYVAPAPPRFVKMVPRIDYEPGGGPPSAADPVYDAPVDMDAHSIAAWGSASLGARPAASIPMVPTQTVALIPSSGPGGRPDQEVVS